MDIQNWLFANIVSNRYRYVTFEELMYYEVPLILQGFNPFPGHRPIRSIVQVKG